MPLGFHFFYRNIRLTELMEIFHGLICVFFGFSENRMCLFVCLLNNTLLPLIQFFLFCLQLRLQCMNFFFIFFNLQAFFFNSHSVCFQSGDYIFKGFILFTDLFFRFIDDIRRQPQFAGNSKRITFSRYSDQKTIGRSKCLHIKFTGRIFYAWCRQRIYFQLTVMGSRHGADPLFLQMIQDSNCQCRSFGGVSTGTQFIKQYQRVWVRLFDKGNHIRHMRRKSTERLFNTLFISDVCIDLIENRKFRTVQCRNMQPGLSHQSKKTYCFQ